MTRRLSSICLALLIAGSASVLIAPRTLGRELVVPMPGELFLTDAEAALVERTMLPNERRLIGRMLGGDHLVVGYSRREYRVVLGPDGRPRPELVAPVTESETSALSLPAEGVAAAAVKPGTDLYISFSVIRTRNSSPYEWMVAPYFEWRGTDGMDRNNDSADTLAVAWAGSTYLHRQQGDGQQRHAWPCNGSPIDLWPSDGTPNTGTAWSFHEWGYWWGCRAWAGWIDIRLRETSWQSRTDNIVYRYYHTYGGREYSFSFSKTPGITVSPTEEQWSLTLFESYRH